MDTDPQIQQDFDKMADYIEEHGWTQNTYRAQDGKVCLVGAYIYGVSPSHAPMSSPMEDELVYRIDVNYRYFITTWNDDRGRTKEQVVGMLRGKDWKEL